MYVSTGSACSSKKSSRVLKACGLERYSKNTLRFSFSGENTLTEAELFCSALSEALRTLIKIKYYWGMQKVSHWLGAYLLDHYDLPDRRGEAAYQGWNQDLAEYRSWLAGMVPEQQPGSMLDGVG